MANITSPISRRLPWTPTRSRPRRSAHILANTFSVRLDGDCRPSAILTRTLSRRLLRLG